MTDEANPLKSYFRSPKLFIGIPTHGKFYTDKVVTMPDSNELPIMAMTARDEMIMKNPDALLNGEAVIQVIKSCVPEIKDPRKLISNDVEVILMAINSATYGDSIDVKGKCPKCSEEVTGIASIESTLDTMAVLEETSTHKTSDGLTIEIRPFTYDCTIRAGIADFQSSRSLQHLSEIGDEMEQLKVFNEKQ